MATILNIDTATENASVCISIGNSIIGLKENDQQRDHAAFIHLAIQQILEESGKKLDDLDAVAVTIGPGSYTGLRVGLATAKGFCFTLGKPLITISTLSVMAQAAQSSGLLFPDELICPMIDARRMEVFTAIFNQELEILMPEKALILDEYSFFDCFKKNNIVFFGSGSTKFQGLKHANNARFIEVYHKVNHLAILALQAFQQNKFSDVAYSEPNYLKEFYTPVK